MATKTLASALDLGRRYNLSLADFLTIFGFGYRVKGRLMAKLYTQSRRVRHRIIAYYSPYGVRPLPVLNWVSMKSVINQYVATLPKVLSLFNEIKVDTRSVLQSLESDSFLELTR